MVDHSDIIVSICCITYNHEKFIRQCINGFLLQKTNFAYEILINDDASTDKTADIIREYVVKYPTMIKPIYQTENQFSKGLGAMNVRFNFPRAQGKYIAMCEGDDYWTDPYKLQKQVDFLEANSEYGLIHTDIEYVDTQSNVTFPHNNVYNEFKSHIKNGYIFDYYLNNHGFIMTVSCMFRSSLIDNKSSNNWFVFDYWLFMEIARQSKVYYFPEKTCAYRINPEGLMSSNPSFARLRSVYVRLDQIYRYYAKNNNKTASYYLKNSKIEKEIVKCLSELSYYIVKGELKDLKKLFIIIFNNPMFIFRIPLYVISKKLSKPIDNK